MRFWDFILNTKEGFKTDVELKMLPFVELKGCPAYLKIFNEKV